MGMWITWGNKAASDKSVGAATELTMDVMLNLYSLNLGTDTGAAMDVASPGAKDFIYYVMFMNPYTTADTNSADQTNVKFDALVVKDTMTVGATTPNTLVTTFKTSGTVNGGIEDSWCATYNDQSTCNADANNNGVTGQANNADWKNNGTDPDNHCVETWTLANPSVRCVRIEGKFKRLFLTGDPTGDIAFGYRPFTISAGWVING